MSLGDMLCELGVGHLARSAPPRPYDQPGLTLALVRTRLISIWSETPRLHRWAYRSFCAAFTEVEAYEDVLRQD